jgi:hypothetical protein
MKANLIFILAIVFGIMSCSGSKKAAKQDDNQKGTEMPQNTGSSSKKYIPEEVGDLYFGMPFKEFIGKYQAASVSEIMSFRKSVEFSNYSDDIKELTIYFDNEGSFPLYELIIEYRDVAVRDKVVEALYGKPNYENEEWQYDSGDGYPIRIWTFESKIIVAFGF